SSRAVALGRSEPLLAHPTLHRSPGVQVVSGAPSRSDDAKARNPLPQELESGICPRCSPQSNRSQNSLESCPPPKRGHNNGGLFVAQRQGRNALDRTAL